MSQLPAKRAAVAACGSRDGGEQLAKRARGTAASSQSTAKRMDWQRAMNSPVTWVSHNPKRAGTQAAKRWDKYCQTTTVAGALKAGASLRDLDSDYAREFLQVTWPADMSAVQDVVKKEPRTLADKEPQGVLQEEHPPLADRESPPPPPCLSRVEQGIQTDPLWLEQELVRQSGRTQILKEALRMYQAQNRS